MGSVVSYGRLEIKSDRKTILVVDDEPSICWGFQQMLQAEGHDVKIASSAEEGLRMATDQAFSLVLLDVRLPGEDGISALPKFRESVGNAPVVIMTAFGDLEIAVEAVRQGASDYLTKPFELEEALRICKTALQSPIVDAFQHAGPSVERSSALVGSSHVMQRLYRQIAVIADSDLSVLISGETGTGKELVARALHRHSRRSAGPYLAVAPVALSEALIESELFGHVRGAFTGAASDRAGLFELADGGTVLLDEIGDLSESVQVKLLRVLEYGEFTRVGDVKPRKCDVRIIAATNCNLLHMVSEGTFREDLYYRLSAVELAVPPLRERLEDLGDLARHFLQQVGHPEPDAAMSESFIAALRGRQWKGNVRELRNAIEHATVLARGRPLLPEYLPANEPVRKSDFTLSDAPAETVRAWAAEQLAVDNGESGKLYDEFLIAFEPTLLQAVLEKTHGNRAAAAELLGIHRGTLRDRLKRYEIDDV